MKGAGGETEHSFELTAWRDGKPSHETRQLAEETAVAISYNGSTHAVLMATPADLEDLAVGLIERVVPGNFVSSPLSATVGNRESREGRRELVFFIKSEIWRRARTVAEEYDFMELEEVRERTSPVDVIQDVLEEITDIPQDIAEELTGEELGSELGGRE